MHCLQQDSVHKAGAGIAQTQASQHLATVQQLGSAQLPSRPVSPPLKLIEHALVVFLVCAYREVVAAYVAA